MSLSAFIDPLRLRQAVLRTASILVPGARRVEWLAEWRAELWHVERAERSKARQSGKRAVATRFCLGAFKDALWVRFNDSRPKSREGGWLISPWHCVLLFAVVAVANVWFAFLPSSQVATFSSQSRFAHFMMLLLALAVVPATTSLSLGEYPQNGKSANRPAGFRRWIFLAIKTGLLVVIVFCGFLNLAAITFTPIQPHGLLVGYVLAFRWTLVDQRRRCPVCLRSLTSPTRIGRYSRTFLEWHGTELVCGRGHGLLHVSANQTSSYGSQRWLNLDSSWSALFPFRR